jgi:type II secretory pathway component PulK
MITRTRQHRGGFALMLAIVLLGLVAMTLVAIAATSFMQSQRSRALAEDAQLRQLLLAGADVAVSRLEKSAPLDATIPLPESLTEQGATLMLHGQTDGDHQTVDITATLDRRNLTQRLHLVHGTSWQVVSAELGA